jgi:hypothetical protein
MAAVVIKSYHAFILDGDVSLEYMFGLFQRYFDEKRMIAVFSDNQFSPLGKRNNYDEMQMRIQEFFPNGLASIIACLAMETDEYTYPARVQLTWLSSGKCTMFYFKRRYGDSIAYSNLCQDIMKFLILEKMDIYKHPYTGEKLTIGDCRTISPLSFLSPPDGEIHIPITPINEVFGHCLENIKSDIEESIIEGMITLLNNFVYLEELDELLQYLIENTVKIVYGVPYVLQFVIIFFQKLHEHKRMKLIESGEIVTILMNASHHVDYVCKALATSLLAELGIPVPVFRELPK